MINIKGHYETFYINADMVESVIERQGYTSEIKLTNGHVYSSIESPEEISERISRAQTQAEAARLWNKA